MSSSRRQLIIDRLTSEFNPDYLEVIDESDQHAGHAGHGGGHRHFAIIISSDSLKQLPRVAAHRKIYDLFIDLMPEQIHALRIKVI